MLEYQRVMAGYHGCDYELVQRVLVEGKHLRASANTWDWLGRGIYFWEYGPQRALEFAYEQKQRGKIETPAVLGAYINLGRCFDLTDTEHTAQMTWAFDQWKEIAEAEGKPLPINRDPKGHQGSDLLLRERDCALINWYMELLDRRANSVYYQSVRGVFVEGKPAYEGAGIMSKTHIQVAIRDPACIIGYFLPTFTFGKESTDGN